VSNLITNSAGEEQAVSATYEAIVLAAERAALLRHLKNLPDECASISFEVYRVATRGFVVFGWGEKTRHLGATKELEKLAEALSLKFGKAVAVHSEEMMQVRDASFYRHGELIGLFGEEDERWAPTDENGEVLPDAQLCPGHAVPEGEEYEFVWDGIDAGLEAAGFRSWLPVGGLMSIARRENLIWERQGGNEKC
jgi:hypothetical protein